jgi:hypothetical protein
LIRNPVTPYTLASIEEDAVTDRTATERVRRYRQRQKKQRDIERVEVQVPAAASDDLKAWGHKTRGAFKRADLASDRVDFVLGTINAPRAKAIDGQTLVHCLLAAEPEKQWQPHIEALFDEVSKEAIHDLVLAGIVSFEDLYRAMRTWRADRGRSAEWVKEMADLRLERPAAYRAEFG